MTKRAREEPSGDDDGAAAAASSAPLATPEIVRLNVGGRAFITTRSTLDKQSTRASIPRPGISADLVRDEDGEVEDFG